MVFRVQTENGVVTATRGFKRDADGILEYPIVDPNDTEHFTDAYAINNHGAVAGRYIGSDNYFHGFLLNDGGFTTIDEGSGPNTWILGMINLDDYAGAFGSQMPPEHGFARIKGVFTQIDVPGEPSAQAHAIAYDGTVVGCAAQGPTTGVAFVRGPKGKIRTFTVANATLTCAVGIDNNVGAIVGYYIDASQNFHGFVYNYISSTSSSGTSSNSVSVTTVDYPGAIITWVTGINAKGIITGLAIPPTRPNIGFIGTPGQ